MTKLPVTFHGRTVLMLETAQDVSTWRWLISSASGEYLVSSEGLPDEAAALTAVKNCARQLVGVLAEGLAIAKV